MNKWGTPEQRNKTAGGLWKNRGFDEKRYARDRDVGGYTECLLGVRELFGYVRKLSSNRVLDIGTGTGNGFSGIMHLFGEGLKPDATVLSRHQRSEIAENLGWENVHITPVETLRGVPDESIACVISVFSVFHSFAPQQAARKIDEKLVKGGVIKMATSKKDAEEYRRLFEELGYDVATGFNVEANNAVILAKKPGVSSPSARELMQADISALPEQRQAVSNLLAEISPRVKA